jgi:hypothetical protein
VKSSTLQSEHRYFSVIAVLIAMTVLAGFVPFYSIRLLRHDPNLTPLVHMHGLVMSAWIALFLTQTFLIAKRRIELHRRLGLAGAAIATLVLAAGIPTLIRGAARQSHDVHSTRFLWMLVAFDGVALVLFAGLFCAEIVFRGRPDYHKRLMLLATLSCWGRRLDELPHSRMGFEATATSACWLCAQGWLLPALL